MPGDLVIHEYGADDAPTLLFLHGLTDSGSAWPDAVDHWGDSWHIVAPDLRGHGDSPRFADDELRHTIEIMTADVDKLLRSFDTPPVVVSHSLGSTLAIFAEDAHPGLIKALVMEDPSMPRYNMSAIKLKFAADNVALLEELDTEEGVAARHELGRSMGWDDEGLYAWIEAKHQVDRRMIVHSIPKNQSWKKIFNRLTIPTLLVQPLHGPVDMGPTEDEVTNPLVQIYKIPDAGHTVRRDNPDAYYALVDPFLAENHS
ncbi:MAG: alpha/beta hydrolase [Propionibacteriaceae bacterium]|nr:alpha/beta hydrolase [Propionibacteriaceae bacterium]